MTVTLTPSSDGVVGSPRDGDLHGGRVVGDGDDHRLPSRLVPSATVMIPEAISVGQVDTWTFDAVAGDSDRVHIGEIMDDNDFRPWIRLASPTGAALGDTAGVAPPSLTMSCPGHGHICGSRSDFDSAWMARHVSLTMTHTPGRSRCRRETTVGRCPTRDAHGCDRAG